MNEKLIIENFGPVKYVDLDLNKINVFIGPNASGKSTVSKIIAILKNADLSPYFLTGTDKENKILNQRFNKLNLSEYINEKFKITYSSEYYKIEKTKYKERFHELKHLSLYRTLYIPMERALISTISESLYGLMSNEVNLPKYFTVFGNEFLKARNHKVVYNIDLFNINYTYENKYDIITLKNGNKLRLSESASSIQSTIPLYLTVQYLTETSEKNHFVIEEPELNLFPKVQKGLINFLIENTYLDNNSLTINTHSPYILMALNNLIEAGNTLKNLKTKDNNKLDEYEEKIKRIVKSNYFIDFDDIAVYYIHQDGTAEDIKDYENRLINAEKIDSVSDIFSDEADKLLDIKYQ